VPDHGHSAASAPLAGAAGGEAEAKRDGVLQPSAGVDQLPGSGECQRSHDTSNPMSIADDLAHARSEEDVKVAYVKALGLKKHAKGLIDIQTDDVWFEAKSGGKKTRNHALRPHEVIHKSVVLYSTI
jgi:hypothetical protein